MATYPEYQNCKLCPRKCGVDRTQGRRGFCQMSDKAVVNLIMHHYGEEPVISGNTKQISAYKSELKGGSGTVFFEGCQLRCVFCQNNAISQCETLQGRYMDAAELAAAYLKLQEEEAFNINLVTASHFIPTVADSIRIARERGLTIPVVFNCGGYENVDSLKFLEGLVDIYLPDMKYYASSISQELATAPDYFEVAKASVAEMVRQIGSISIDDRGIMRRGVIVRHLMLPNELFESKKIIDYLMETYDNGIYISLMCQYTPCRDFILKNLHLSDKRKQKLLGTLNPKHYEHMVDYMAALGQERAFVQDFTSTGNELLPDFKK